MIRRNSGNLLWQDFKFKNWTHPLYVADCLLLSGCYIVLGKYGLSPRKSQIDCFYSSSWGTGRCCIICWLNVLNLLLRTRNLNLHLTSCELWFSLDCKPKLPETAPYRAETLFSVSDTFQIRKRQKKRLKNVFRDAKNVLGFENPFSRRIDGKTLPFSGNAIRIRVFGNVNLFSSIVLSGW